MAPACLGPSLLEIGMALVGFPPTPYLIVLQAFGGREHL